MWVPSLNREDPLEEGMATHSRNLAWRIPRTEEPGGLESMGSQRIRHDWSDFAAAVCKNHTESNAAQSGAEEEVGEDTCVPTAVQTLFCLCGWCGVSDPQRNRDLPILNLSSWSSTLSLRVLTSPSGIPSGDGTSQHLAYLSFLEWWAHMHFLTSPASSYGHVPYQPRKYGEVAHPIPGMPRNTAMPDHLSLPPCTAYKEDLEADRTRDTKDSGHCLPEKRLYANSHCIVTWRKNRLTVLRHSI